MLFWLIHICLCLNCPPNWGFFGHRQINRHAVYIMPPPLNQFFKKHIAYLEEHSVDADKRRYALPQEYKRHYIDLDHHEATLGCDLSDDLHAEIRNQLLIKVIQKSGDTTTLLLNDDLGEFKTGQDDPCGWKKSDVQGLLDTLMAAEPYEEVWIADPNAFKHFVNTCGKHPDWQSLIIEDQFSIHGILPYWLVIMQRRLTNAFLAKDVSLVMKLAADIGHYIGDAHVPLHTTRNYNGQLTGQQGIHGFWESRIPELFYEEWELVTGSAVYIPDFKANVWKIVRESFNLVGKVLNLEAEVRKNMPEDQVMCFEDRNALNMLSYCPGFAKAYATAMDGMVEERFKSAIHTIGSAWYTAWVDAGQPSLWEVEEPMKPAVPEENSTPAVQPFGRPHDN